MRDSPAAARPPESVWDYPRPPAVREVQERIEVWFAGGRIAACDRAIQVLENQSPADVLPAD